MSTLTEDTYKLIAGAADFVALHYDFVDGYFEELDRREILQVPDSDLSVQQHIYWAGLCDLLLIVRSSIQADRKISDEELEFAASILSALTHTVKLPKRYRDYRFISDGDDLLDLLEFWSEDIEVLGGDFESGSYKNPFLEIIQCICALENSTKFFDEYRQVMSGVALNILESDGIGSGEHNFYVSLVQQFDKLEESINLIIKSERPPHAKNECIEAKKKDKICTDRISRNSSNKDILIESNEANFETNEDQLSGLSELDSLVGVESVKEEIRRLANFLKVNQKRVENNLPTSIQSLQFVFTGNPGTGKTTVARILARILHEYGVLKSSNLIEVDRSALVGGYIGQTAIKTKEILSKATDGVLFIDEAYTLSRSQGEDYGKEAIDTILKSMEDLRERLVVIVAGYPKEMDVFINSNPGLKSRFTRFIRFEDYHVADLCRIFEKMCQSNAYELTSDAKGNLSILLNIAYSNKDLHFGNARFARNAFEYTLGNHSDRLSKIKNLNKEDLVKITGLDLPYNLVDGIDGPLDLSNSKWKQSCEMCGEKTIVTLEQIGQKYACECGHSAISPWWNIISNSITLPDNYEEYSRQSDLFAYN